MIDAGSIFFPENDYIKMNINQKLLISVMFRTYIYFFHSEIVNILQTHLSQVDRIESHFNYRNNKTCRSFLPMDNYNLKEFISNSYSLGLNVIVSGKFS